MWFLFQSAIILAVMAPIIQWDESYKGAAAREPRTQRFGFEICVPLEPAPKPEPPGGWSNCATMESKTRADCEKAREIFKRRGLTTGPCKEVDDVK